MLPTILNIPRTPEQWAIFSYNHRLSHDQIRAAILKQKNLNLTDYQIDPISEDDLVGWLERNTQLHDDMNQAIGVQSQDLQDVNMNDENQKRAWFYIHWLEHQTAEQTLGIGS